jgi:hypothetical protein
MKRINAENVGSMKMEKPKGGKKEEEEKINTMKKEAKNVLKTKEEEEEEEGKMKKEQKNMRKNVQGKN